MPELYIHYDETLPRFDHAGRERFGNPVRLIIADTVHDMINIQLEDGDTSIELNINRREACMVIAALACAIKETSL